MTPDHADSEIPDDPRGPDLTPEHLRRALEVTSQKGPGRAQRGPPEVIRDLKERFVKHELPLGDYVQGLVAFRTSGLEQELSTDATPDTTVRAASTQVAAANTAPSDWPARSDGTTQPAARTSPAPAVRPAPAGVVAHSPARLSPVCAVLGGRFELEECVGKGGTADVYRARDLLADQYDREHSTVAVKVLHRELHGDPPLLREILRAAATMRRLRHGAIAQVFEVHHLDGDYMVVTEWLEGESLAQRLDGRAHPALGAAELATLVADIGSALEYAHRHGIVHGDIKPGNVFLTERGGAKLVDLGFRRPPGTPPGNAGARGFTARYASCDVLEGQVPTPEDDVYSLACLIYRVAAGTWPTGNLTALEAEAAGWMPAPPTSLAPSQWRVLRDALAPRRAGRSASLADLVGAFATQPPPEKRNAAHGTGLALAAGLALLAWQAWNYWQSPAGKESLPVATATVAPAAVTEPLAPAETTGPAEVPVEAPLVAPVESVIEPVVPAAVELDIAPLPPAPVAVPAEPAPAPPRPVPSGPATINIKPVGQWVASESDPFVRFAVRAVRPRGPIVLNVAARGGAATVNEDFVPPVAQLVLTPRRPAAEVLVSLIGDSRPENVEDFSVNFSVAEGDARLATDSVVVVLTDDD